MALESTVMPTMKRMTSQLMQRTMSDTVEILNAPKTSSTSTVTMLAGMGVLPSSATSTTKARKVMPTIMQSRRLPVVEVLTSSAGAGAGSSWLPQRSGW